MKLLPKLIDRQSQDHHQYLNCKENHCVKEDDYNEENNYIKGDACVEEKRWSK